MILLSLRERLPVAWEVGIHPMENRGRQVPVLTLLFPLRLSHEASQPLVGEVPAGRELFAPVGIVMKHASLNRFHRCSTPESKTDELADAPSSAGKTCLCREGAADRARQTDSSPPVAALDTGRS
jgi:hypothetical protein